MIPQVVGAKAEDTRLVFILWQKGLWDTYDMISFYQFGYGSVYIKNMQSLTLGGPLAIQ